MTKFAKGKSGNPAGRPKGIRDKRVALRSLLEPHAEALIQQLVDRALEGDMTALKLALERILPPYKATDMPAQLPALKGALPERGEALIQAMAKGQLTPADTKQLVEVLTAQARLVELVELESRLTKLEEQHALNNAT